MISTIRLQNFRSYKDSSFEFEEGVNIIFGPNASGKTNLLEAVMMLAQSSSYRARDAEVIKFGKDWARVEGSFQNQARVLKIKDEAGQTFKVFEIDTKPFKRLGFERTVPVVYFEPNHIQLISRGPDQRRNYFDELLERSQPGFKSLAASYRRTLAQRNALLKRGRGSAAEQLFAWDVRLSELGSQVAQARQTLVDEINQTISKTYSQIAKRKSEVKLEYAALNNQPAGQSASRGETRSLLLALKIFELRLIEKARGQKPIFLLDDVFSELDGARRRALWLQAIS
jgi:DNA replication and repair protein RecF